MKYCTNCGAQLPDEAKFCESCGEIIRRKNDGKLSHQHETAERAQE